MGDRDELAVERSDTDTIVITDGYECRAVDHPVFLEAVTDQPQGERGGIHREREPAQNMS